MLFMPPSGSAITVNAIGDAPEIIIPHPENLKARRFGLAVSLISIPIWALVVTHQGFDWQFETLRQMSVPVLIALAFTILIPIIGAHRYARPANPERLLLTPEELRQDRGRFVPPLKFVAGSQKQIKPDRKQFFPVEEMHMLNLIESGTESQLVIDIGGTNYDLGISASTEERRWLYHLLRAYYRLEDH